MPQRTTPGPPGPAAPPGRGAVAGRIRSTVAPRLVAVALVVSAGGLAGCGGQAQQVRDAGVYTAEVNDANAGFERDVQALNRAADQATDRPAVVRAVQRLEDRIGGVQSELRGIRPPAVAADAHQALIDAYARWSGPVQRFRRALRDRSPRAAQRAKAAFATASTQVDRQVMVASRQINDALRTLSD